MPAEHTTAATSCGLYVLQISASNILPKMSGGEQHAATAAQLAANAIRKQPQVLQTKSVLRLEL